MRQLSGRSIQDEGFALTLVVGNQRATGHMFWQTRPLMLGQVNDLVPLGVFAQNLLIAVPDFELVGQRQIHFGQVCPHTPVSRDGAAAHIGVKLVQRLTGVFREVLAALVGVKDRVPVEGTAAHRHNAFAQRAVNVYWRVNDHVGVKVEGRAVQPQIRPRRRSGKHQVTTVNVHHNGGGDARYGWGVTICDLDHLRARVVGMDGRNHFGRQGDVVAYVEKYKPHGKNIC